MEQQNIWLKEWKMIQFISVVRYFTRRELALEMSPVLAMFSTTSFCANCYMRKEGHHP